MSKTKNILKKRSVQLAGGTVGALALTLTLASPSSAAASGYYSAECSTTGAWGRIIAEYYGASSRLDFDMTIGDTLGDGHHARARLITKNANGTRKNWAWHSAVGNNETVSLSTYAIDSSGIHDWGVQVARFEGDSLMNSCTNWMS
ncbi:hypothetical protein ABT127_26675 [Streptomyces sp. NPDC001904]|uniref:hypothetical protein n=1 Tax=Streptomyces sp. NPDC001904 TaxID=3154531 RepID=UPI0033323466